jgi:predicted outer membrane protein
MRGAGRAREPTTTFEQESIMQNNKVLKRLLAVTTVAAMFSAFGVHAQTAGSTSGQSNMTGKTTSQGTVGNTNSRGTDEKMQGTQGAQGSSGAGVGGTQSSGNPAISGTSQGSAGAGATTREGTVGNTNSQGMEARQPAKNDQMSGSSGASGAAGAAASGSAKLSSSDEKIVKDMAQANINEIEAGKMAQSKSTNDQVKSFAQQMIDDHGKALSEVQALAQQKGVTLPTEPDAKHKAMAKKMETLSGDAFDKAYMSQAGSADHKKVHSMLLSDEKKAKDPDVKAAATKMAPVVEQHLKSAEQIRSSKSSSGTTSGK